MSNPADKVAGFVRAAVAKPVAQLKQLAGEMEATKARFEAMMAEYEQQIQTKVEELNAKLAEVDEQLGSFNNLEGDDADPADFDLGGYAPTSSPDLEAFHVKMDNLESRMLEMAGRMNSLQQEALAPVPPPPPPAPSGGFSPFVTHDKMQRAVDDLEASIPDKITQWVYDNSHLLIEVTQPRGVRNGPSGPVTTRDAELEDSLDF